MVEVYYYMPLNEVENAVECGIKLSRWYDREVLIGGESRKCISAFLNPKDDTKKYKSSELKCLKLEVAPQYCYVADKYLYQVGANSLDAMNMYLESIIPIENYIFGSYRLPECLITTTVISEQIGLLDRGLGSPIFYDKSEELYINNIIETYREEYEDFNDTLLYSFYCTLAESGKLHKIEDSESRIAIFVDKEKGRNFTIRIPDMSKY